MKSLIHQDDWLKDTVSDRDIADWNPELGDCCTANAFRLHLAGTKSDPWNESATRVFANDFLAKNAETYPDNWTVRSMVLKKTRAYVKTLIHYFREQPKNKDVKNENRRAKNRRERKANVSTCRIAYTNLILVDHTAISSSSRHHLRLSTDATTAAHAGATGYRWYV